MLIKIKNKNFLARKQVNLTENTNKATEIPKSNLSKYL